ncbi:MAG: PLD nuclease N-terminal domain-containing protein, partial [Christensenellaceae bacterium]
MKKIFAFLTGRLFIFFALIGLETWFLIAMVYSIDEQLSPVINIIQYFAAVFLVLYIVNKDQDPSYKMAWMIPILALPLLGMMLYFFFSQRKLNKWERKKALEIFKNT